MKFTKFLNILLIVLIVAAFAVVPAFAFDGTPPVDAPVFDMDEIAKTLETLITAILIPLILWLSRLASAKANIEVLKLSAQNKSAFRAAARTFIYAAEQLKASEYIHDKLDWVMEQMELWLAARRLPINLNDIRAEVEAIIAEELNYEKLLKSSEVE